MEPNLSLLDVSKSVDEAQGMSQEVALSVLLSRKNVFLSGGGGTGKTTVISEFCRKLDSIPEPIFYEVTAATGVAAASIGGRTVHSFSGLGISEKFDKDNPPFFVLPTLKQLDVLIIDEISMLSAAFLDALNDLLKYAKRNNTPFGGVQMVLVGDFMQLPPVKGDFCFKAKAWQEANLTKIVLKKLRRASCPDLTKILTDLVSPEGFSDESRRLVESRVNAPKDPNKKYAVLYTRNTEVEEHNLRELQNFPPETEETFLPQPAKIEDPRNNDALIKRLRLEPLTVRLGATVMVTVNSTDNRGDLIANGSIGEVIGYKREFNAKKIAYIKVRLNDGRIVDIARHCYTQQKTKVVEEKFFNYATNKTETYSVKEVFKVADVRHFPLRLAFAITIHKSQGQTFNGVEADLRKCFAMGLGYVALSRIQALDDLVLAGIDDSAYQMDQKTVAKIGEFRAESDLVLHEVLENAEHYNNLNQNVLYRQVFWEKPPQTQPSKGLFGGGSV